jgi:hypothetical protein
MIVRFRSTRGQLDSWSFPLATSWGRHQARSCHRSLDMAILCLLYQHNLVIFSYSAGSSVNLSETTCSRSTVRISRPCLYKLRARYRYHESVMPAPLSGPCCSYGVGTPKTGSRTSKMRGSTYSIYVSAHLFGVVLLDVICSKRLIGVTDTREWTRIMALGARPKGRYGHAVCMSGNTFYVSGGQVDGRFMNDLWGFDLSTCELVNLCRPAGSHVASRTLTGIATTVMVAPTWHVVQPANKAPSPRTGHVLVTYQDKLYM